MRATDLPPARGDEAEEYRATPPLRLRPCRIRRKRQNLGVASPAKYPARLASVSELERLSDKARELRGDKLGIPALGGR